MHTPFADASFFQVQSDLQLDPSQKGVIVYPGEAGEAEDDQTPKKKTVSTGKNKNKITRRSKNGHSAFTTKKRASRLTSSLSKPMTPGLSHSASAPVMPAGSTVSDFSHTQPNIKIEKKPQDIIEEQTSYLNTEVMLSAPFLQLKQTSGLGLSNTITLRPRPGSRQVPVPRKSSSVSSPTNVGSKITKSNIRLDKLISKSKKTHAGSDSLSASGSGGGDWSESEAVASEVYRII